MRLVKRDPAYDLQDAAEDIKQLLADVEALAYATAEAAEVLPQLKDREGARKVHRLIVLVRVTATQAAANLEAATDIFNRATTRYSAEKNS